MDVPIILLGILLGLIFAAKEMVKQEERKAGQRSRIPSGSNLREIPPQLPSTVVYKPPTSVTFRPLNESVRDILREAARESDARRGISRPPPYRQTSNEVVSGRTLIEKWRESVLGLIKLAESNLQRAKSQAAIMNYEAAAESAATSVENVSRALLHCYGEKPDLDSGQEEPLRLLVRRLQGEERVEFKRAIDEAVRLYRTRVVQGYISEKGIQAPILRGTKTQLTVEIAERIVTLFKQIIDEHFATEIPELRERCPECGAVNITLWTFGSQGSTYQCYVCSHKWIQPTQ